MENGDAVKFIWLSPDSWDAADCTASSSIGHGRRSQVTDLRNSSCICPRSGGKFAIVRRGTTEKGPSISEGPFHFVVFHIGRVADKAAMFPIYKAVAAPGGKIRTESLVFDIHVSPVQLPTACPASPCQAESARRKTSKILCFCRKVW